MNNHNFFTTTEPNNDRFEGGAVEEALSYIRDSVTEESKWYFLVYKPYDKSYDRDSDWYAFKGLDHVRRSLRGCTTLILTREILAGKIHINALCNSIEDLSNMHNKSTNKYKIYCEECRSRSASLYYMFKEARQRAFIYYLDYYIYNAKAEEESSDQEIIIQENEQE